MRRYLLVDDNREFAENLAEIISDEGDEVSIATSGTEALERVKAQRFDAMLTDMRMPVMGGAELVHLTRAADPGLPALVATAYSGDADLQIARNEGLLGVLQKPVPVRHLLSLLRNARRDGIVVIVEDDTQLADNLSEVLREHGFTSVSAASIAETERLGNLRPFAAIVDLRVPGGPDGEAMRRLEQRFPNLPQIVITGHDPSAIPFPPECVLKKPFKPMELLQAVTALYERRSERA